MGKKSKKDRKKDKKALGKDPSKKIKRSKDPKAKKSKSSKVIDKPNRCEKDKKSDRASKQKALEVCPCCSKHCPLSKPKCGKGKRIRDKRGI